MDCVVLNQERDKWQVLLNTVMNLRVLQYARKSLLHGVCWLVMRRNKFGDFTTVICDVIGDNKQHLYGTHFHPHKMKSGQLTICDGTDFSRVFRIVHITFVSVFITTVKPTTTHCNRRTQHIVYLSGIKPSYTCSHPQAVCKEVDKTWQSGFKKQVNWWME